MISDGRRCFGSGGFTLLELMVALSIAGLVVLGAHATLRQLADAGDRIVSAANEGDQEANLERWLRRLVVQTQPGDGRVAHFVGREDSAVFSTWCESPAGWQESCEVRLVLQDPERPGELTVSVADAELVTIRHGIDSGRFLYLYSASEAGTWLSEWVSTVSTPLALGIVLNGDTLILRIGERG